MNSQTFEGVFDRTVEYAKTSFLESGDLIQTVLLGWDTEDGIITCVVAFGDYDDNVRNALPKIFTEAIQKLTKEEPEVKGQPDWYVQQTEAWMVAIPVDDLSEEELEEMKKGMPSSPKGSPRPMDHPDRKEILLIQGATKGGESKVWAAEINREPNTHLSDPQTEGLEHLKSRVGVILWEDGPFPEEDMGTTGGLLLDITLEQDLEHLKKSAAKAIAQLGKDPTNAEVMRMGADWIKATVNSDLGKALPSEIKQGLLRAADLMEEKESVQI
ncbi:MAG: hypothetical protein QQN63_08575 [Nitrosopumilus sp.]